MKLLRNLAVAAITAVATISPAMARVEAGTGNLLKVLAENGIYVTINEQCDGRYHGMYRFVGMKREMHLCPGDTVDAIDHSTVRHEATHAIQHCVNVARGTHINTPILSYEELRDAVNTYLSEDTVNFIKEAYPQEHWLVELEANLLEQTATADELLELFVDACVGG